ncbi:MAG: helix-hairpin-helix domain-containing protein [Bacteroidales bacterium]|jgi:competence ComEA-like helix-hairpin-helix protein|nr:helix-hairpin-helix domain-containing protein [Bacteroidales bacterium]
MSWKDDLKKYLGFSRSERYGIITLCSLILAALIIKICLPLWIKDRPYDSSAYEEELGLYRKRVDSVQRNHLPDETPLPLVEVTYFYFDPNTITDHEWKKLGFNDRQIRNIRNYQSKGGSFKKKEDLKKLYTVPAVLYASVEPYIQITRDKAEYLEASHTTSVSEVKNDGFSLKTANKDVKIELNSADSALLTALPGIGPVFASRIIKYRNLIGGFENVEQLNEVYGISPDLFTRISPLLSIDRSMIRKIDINRASYRELIGHPYLNDEQVRGILHYRKLQDSIGTLDELVRNHIIKQDLSDRIRPYISY